MQIRARLDQLGPYAFIFGFLDVVVDNELVGIHAAQQARLASRDGDVLDPAGSLLRREQVLFQEAVDRKKLFLNGRARKLHGQLITCECVLWRCEGCAVNLLF